MRKRIQKTTGTFRRGIACTMAAALALSSLAQAPSSEAAGKKKPTLSVKKRHCTGISQAAKIIP